jgi:hypothetical protein
LIVLFLQISNLSMSRVLAENQATQALDFAKHSVDNTPDNIGMLVAKDIDTDQDLDLIGSISLSGLYKIVWWENDGTPASGSWTRRDIGSSTNWITEIEVADMDNDTDW